MRGNGGTAANRRAAGTVATGSELEDRERENRTAINEITRQLNTSALAFERAVARIEALEKWRDFQDKRDERQQDWQQERRTRTPDDIRGWITVAISILAVIIAATGGHITFH